MVSSYPQKVAHCSEGHPVQTLHNAMMEYTMLGAGTLCGLVWSGFLLPTLQQICYTVL